MLIKKSESSTFKTKITIGTPNDVNTKGAEISVPLEYSSSCSELLKCSQLIVRLMLL